MQTAGTLHPLHPTPADGLPVGVGIGLSIDNHDEIRSTFGHEAFARLRVRIERLLRSRVRGTDQLTWTQGLLTMHVPGMDSATAAAVANRLRRELPRDVQLGGYLIRLSIRLSLVPAAD